MRRADESARVWAGGYGPRLALRHLLSGAAAPRRAMREAQTAGLGEAGRCGLLLACVAAVTLADPAEDGVPRALADHVAQSATTVAALIDLGIWTGLAAAAILAVYALTAGLLWLATRPAENRPGHAIIRSALAVGSWASTLPVIAAGLVLHLAGLDLLADVLLVALGAAFVGLCLSEATGLDARAGMGLATGAFLLAGFAFVALFATLSGWAARTAEEPGHLSSGTAP